jgi:hypothetical protein
MNHSKYPWQRWSLPQLNRRNKVIAAATAGAVVALGAGILTVELTGSDRAGAPGSGSAARAPHGPGPSGSAPAAGSPGPETATPPPQIPPKLIQPSPAVVNSGSLAKDHHTLRVVSSHSDLTGQREQAWAADDGHAVGDVRCTQNLHIGVNSTPAVRPTTLLCWRTSATKSVLTVAVDIDHKPSEKASAAKIDQVWQQLG